MDREEEHLAFVLDISTMDAYLSSYPAKVLRANIHSLIHSLLRLYRSATETRRLLVSNDGMSNGVASSRHHSSL